MKIFRNLATSHQNICDAFHIHFMSKHVALLSCFLRARNKRLFQVFSEILHFSFSLNCVHNLHTHKATLFSNHLFSNKKIEIVNNCIEGLFKRVPK